MNKKLTNFITKIAIFCECKHPLLYTKVQQEMYRNVGGKVELFTGDRVL